VVVTATPGPATPTPAPNQPSSVAPEATQTARVVTATPPSATDAPAASSTPAATATPPFALPFTDDFNNGISSQWQILFGDYTVSDQGITINYIAQNIGTNNLRMQVGDANLQNFVEEFDYSGLTIYQNYYYFGNLRLLARQPGYGGQWEVLQNSDWQPTGNKPSDMPKSGHFRAEVSGHTITVTVNGQQVDHRTFSFSITGPVGFEIEESDLKISHFKLTALP
jgi:hypothetical protein